MSRNTVLVTGGSGFIGTWVVRELYARGKDALVLDVRPAADRWQRVLGAEARDLVFLNTPLTDRDALRALIENHHVTHIIHLAALLTPDCQQDPYHGCQVNVLGSTAVFDAARLAGSVQAIAFASSYAVYGNANAKGLQPPMFYGAFKQAVDQIAGQYWTHFNLRSLAIRPHIVYGPERETGLTAGPSRACRAAVCGESYHIGYTGAAGYDYVEDVARAFVHGVLECPAGATVVDLPSEIVTTEEIVRQIESCLPEANGHITTSGPVIPANVPTEFYDIRNVLPDWQPTSLANGIAKTIAYYHQVERRA